MGLVLKKHTQQITAEDVDQEEVDQNVEEGYEKLVIHGNFS